MSYTTDRHGRLGNRIIRNLSVSLVAKKHNLKVQYIDNDLINKLGIELFSGSNSYNCNEPLRDDNYFKIYNIDEINYNVNSDASYFQTKEITNFLYNYLHKDEIKSKIIDNNPFKTRYNENNDLCIHIRLTDVAHFNPGIKYYINAIKNIIYDNLYISTDDKNNSIIIELLQLYPSSQLIEFDEINTFQFASTCKNIVLSHGTFSAIIGYLSFFSNIYYPECELWRLWHGDMFSIDNWIKLSVN